MVASTAQFRYWDPTWWENYFKNDLYNLYRSLHCLNKYKELIIKEIQGAGDLKGLLEKNYDFWIKVFMGGVKKECVKIGHVTWWDCIPENSIVAFYRKVMGIQFSEDDMNKYIAKVMGGVDVKSAGEDIQPSIYRTRDLYDDLRRVFEQREIGELIGKSEPECNVELKDPMDAINLYIEFINNVRRILPLYNDVSFFIQSLHSTPRFYIKQVYGNEIFSNNTQQTLQRYGIKLRTLINAPKGLEEYDMVGYEINSVGEILAHMLRKAWDYANPIVPVAKGPTISYRDYVDVYLNDADNDVRTYLGRSLGRRYDKDYYAVIIGTLKRINEYQIKIEIIRNDNNRQGSIPQHEIPYVQFVNAFAKALFTGLAMIDENENGEMTIDVQL